jgi:hypothetical protein
MPKQFLRIGITALLASVLLLRGYGTPPITGAAGTQGTPTYGSAVSVDHVAGVVSAVDDHSITLQRSGGAVTLRVAPRAIVLLADGTIGQIGQLPIGVFVMIWVRGNAGGTPQVTAIAVLNRDVLAAGEPAQTPATSPTPTSSTAVQAVNGTIFSLTSSTLGLTTLDGTQTTYPLAGSISVYVDGQRSTLGAVAPPVQARVYLRAAPGRTLSVIGIIVGGEGAATASATPAASQTGSPSGSVSALNGTITAISSAGLSFTAADGTQAVYPFSPHVSIKVNGHSGGLSLLPLPQQARIYLRTTPGGTPMLVGVVVGSEGTVAATATIPPGSPVPAASPTAESTGINGTITAVSATGLSFTAADGSQTTYAWGSHVSIVVHGHNGGLSELPLPQAAHIYVRSVPGAEPVLLAVVVGGETTPSTATPTN